MSPVIILSVKIFYMILELSSLKTTSELSILFYWLISPEHGQSGSCTISLLFSSSYFSKMLVGKAVDSPRVRKDI